MSPTPSQPSYLDVLFGSLRSLSREIAATKGWLKNAESSKPSPWSLQFLAAARASYDRAHAHLESAEAHVRDLGPVDEIPAPLDRVPINVAAMKADLHAQKSHMSRLFSELAARPLGRS